MRQGAFRDDLDVEATGSILLDLQSATLMFHFTGDLESPELQRRALAGFRLLLDGLRAVP
jgi:hypothetical protein